MTISSTEIYGFIVMTITSLLFTGILMLSAFIALQHRRWNKALIVLGSYLCIGVCLFYLFWPSTMLGLSQQVALALWAMFGLVFWRKPGPKDGQQSEQGSLNE